MFRTVSAVVILAVALVLIVLGLIRVYNNGCTVKRAKA
jgi:hypothetical protein